MKNVSTICFILSPIVTRFNIPLRRYFAFQNVR